MASINERFFPPKEVYDKLSIREQEQLTLLTGSNLVFMLLFFIFGLVLFIFKYVIVGAGGMFILAFLELLSIL